MNYQTESDSIVVLLADFAISESYLTTLNGALEESFTSLARSDAVVET